ncbi:piggyBac transposable element-derived protein 4-like [Anastrepha obliqua]|uniref:piggyBac transposable element-derived protein 4-like n=1 Tax=Anastrepha obliqua TaxID=95512 RepID=UPI002409CC90|nr:piggyBac transposable element-derived protein 4-like [Anastrepha obliqua]
MQRSLTQREIEECFCEDLPSGPESEPSSDEDENLDTPEWPVSKSILDVCGADVQNIHEELFDDEDDIPLSNFVSQNNIVSSTTLQPPKWKRTFSMDIPGEFVESVGLADHIISLEDLTPLRLFHMFWTEDLVEVISFQTNLYATQEGKPFSPTSPSEIQTFLAINMVMGIKKLPSYKDYWCSDPDLRDSYISSYMPLNRFSWLLGCLHLNDNNLMSARTHLDYDKLYKVRPMLEILRRNFRNNYKPSECVAIDENMIKCKDVEQVTRRERDGSAAKIDCPLAIKKYNSNMNFVDKFDQIKACYSIDGKSQKWLHRIFFHFLDCCVINSYIAYKELQINRPHLDELTLKDFRGSIYQWLLAACYVKSELEEVPRSAMVQAQDLLYQLL